ncbi:MAG: MoxR family ATPase [Neisseriaceae bacterium]|nr:MoxR family ATPase [Neisseriaceae bacterium]
MDSENNFQAAFESATHMLQNIREHLNRVIIGQKAVIDQSLVALIAGGHILLEGVPGTGKTLLVRALAKSFGGTFNRIQFTPDLMPSDITGNYWFNGKEQVFVLRQGPIFTNLLLADEINRAPAKTQAALLQVMQEYAVSLDGKTHTVPLPFMVLATQNPIEQEGTYPLPEAQLDRFMFKVLVDYPDNADEVRLVEAVSTAHNNDLLAKIDNPTLFSPQQISQVQVCANQITADHHIIDYAVRLVRATRNSHGFSVGAGPRAGIALVNGAKAHALLNGMPFATPDNIKAVCLPTLRHRVRLSIEAEMAGQSIDEILQEIINQTEAPRQ